MPSPERMKVAHDPSFSFEEPTDFDFDPPADDEPDSGMSKFSSLTTDPEGVDEAAEDEPGFVTDEAPTGAEAPAAAEVSTKMEDLRTRAEEVGIAPEQLVGLKTSQVEALLDSFDAHLDGIAIAEPEEKTPTKKVATQTEDVTTDVPDQLKFEFDEDADPGMVKAFGAIANFLNKQAGQLSDIQASADNQSATNLSTRNDTRFDALVQQHGKTAVNLFGGDGKLRPAQKANRQSVTTALSILVQGHKAAGTQMPKESALFDTALKSALGEKYAKLVSGVKTEAVSKRKAQHQQRPQSRTPNKGTMSPGRKAVQSVAALMKERGMLDEHVEEPADDEFIVKTPA